MPSQYNSAFLSFVGSNAVSIGRIEEIIAAIGKSLASDTSSRARGS
jgi:hypothetical protein